MQEQNNDYVEESLTFRELATRIGIVDLDTPEVYEVEEEGYEIESLDLDSGKIVWKPLTHFVVKNNAKHHYQLNTLHGTEMHRILHEGEWKSLKEIPGAELVNSSIQVVDVTVADTHNYLAEGQINHNTTTPGGMAIPFASSVRIRLQGGQHIEDPKTKNIIGIKTVAKTIKNKIGMPFRECKFDIIFGHGIREAEDVFDCLRQRCDGEKDKLLKSPDGKYLIGMEGLSSWKTFQVINAETGEHIVQPIKFYKHEFGDKILYNPEFLPYIRILMDSTYVMRLGETSHPTHRGQEDTDDTLGQGG